MCTPQGFLWVSRDAAPPRLPGAEAAISRREPPRVCPPCALPQAVALRLSPSGFGHRCLGSEKRLEVEVMVPRPKPQMVTFNS